MKMLAAILVVASAACATAARPAPTRPSAKPAMFLDGRPVWAAARKAGLWRLARRNLNVGCWHEDASTLAVQRPGAAPLSYGCAWNCVDLPGIGKRGLMLLFAMAPGGTWTLDSAHALPPSCGPHHAAPAR